MERYDCDACSFGYDLSAAPIAAADDLPPLVADLVEILTEAPEPGDRRFPSVWSPLEYACHLRDVLLVQRERVFTARRVTRPTLEPMGRDERVDYDGYADQHLEDVLRQLQDASLLLGHVLRRLSRTDWERTVIYSFPSPQERSLAWVAVHTLHEVHHHTHDIRRQIL